MKLMKSSLLAVTLLAVSGSVLAGIATSKHNLGGTNATFNRLSGGTTDGEICVFCHTPHGSNVSVKAPLWNKSTPASTYQVYDTTWSATMTAGGGAYTSGGNPVPGGVSLACLSCHDGTQAMDNMINRPGSGGFTSGTGSYMVGATWSQGSGNTLGTTAGVQTAVGAFGKLTSGIAALGTDLRNDHPISIYYCGASAALTDNSTANCQDPDFNAPRRSGTNNFWVDVSGVGTAGTKDKTDMVLYSSSISDRMTVECASCHDPHQGANNTFLRTNNTNSRVCLACHNK